MGRVHGVAKSWTDLVTKQQHVPSVVYTFKKTYLKFLLDSPAGSFSVTFQ